MAILIVWFAARAVYWNGYYVEDSPGYVSDAIWAAIGDYHVRDHVNGLNVGTYLPVAVPLWLFGKSEIALSVWPMTCSLIGLLSLAGTSAVLFGRWSGLFAGLLYATYPGDVFFSTVVMPDALQAGWLSFSIFLAALAHTQPRYRKLAAAAGAAMGICHLMRANDPVLVPIGLGAVAACSRLWRHEPIAATLRSCALFAAGVGAIYIGEGLVYWLTIGDFLHRFHVVGGHYGSAASIAQAGLNVDPRTIPFSIFPPVLWWQQSLQPLNQDQAYHALQFCWALLALIAGSLVLALARRVVDDAACAGIALAAVWFAWPLLYHQFGSQSVTAYVPMHRLSRHLVVYAPGAVFATVAGCALVARASRSASTTVQASLLAIGCALLAIHLTFNQQGVSIAHQAYQQIKGTYQRIRDELPADVRTITADPGDLCFFEFWLNPLGREAVRVVPFANVAGCSEVRDGVVLTFSNPGWHGGQAPIIRETVARLPCLLDPPKDWRLLYDGYPERVYLVAR
jgi:hypothetical protein